MSIPVTCPGCGKNLKAKDSMAGRKVKCPHCAHPLTIPGAEEDTSAIPLAPEPPPPRPPLPVQRDEAEESAEDRPAARRKRAVGVMEPLKSEETPTWLRHLHWLLVLALIPLAVSLLKKGEDEMEFLERLAATVKNSPPEVQQRITAALDSGNIDGVFEALPDHKLTGAALPRRSWVHWCLAGASAALFLLFFMFLASDGSANPLHLFALGLFTATIGIMFLLIVQFVAVFSSGIWLRGHGVVVLLFYFLKLIGFSYQAALDPDNGFLLSAFGFTMGVGFCEEVCKALPLFLYIGYPEGQRWRGAFLWGLASGVGFGVSEGITYSSDYYNGVHGPGIYFVRFLSCVALHALWSGSVAITMYRKQDWLREERPWYGYLVVLYGLVAVPMVLHGLYDTLLKKEMNALALGIAGLSFVYLAFQISMLNREDDSAAEKKLLRKYKKRRSALS